MTRETVSVGTVAADKCFTALLIYKYVYKCIYTYTHSTYILYTSVCTIVLQAYTTQGEGVNPLTRIVLNGNSVLNLHDIFGNVTQA
jgi:hypothetical protein